MMMIKITMQKIIQIIMMLKLNILVKMIIIVMIIKFHPTGETYTARYRPTVVPVKLVKCFLQQRRADTIDRKQTRADKMDHKQTSKDEQIQ